ncbi:MAG: LysR family transcriptional regulator, partial [Bdellovibrionia bacterium]
MSLNSLYLDAFFACAQLEHFTKAAERLHITQSALSQRIKNLEQELGSTLIIRDRAGLKLTEFGHELLRYCHTKERLETEIMGRVEGRAHKDLRGVIRVGGFSSIVRSVVMPALAPLLLKNPDVEFKALTRELYDLPSLLKSGEIDFVVIDEVLHQEGIVHHTLGTERNV